MCDLTELPTDATVAIILQYITLLCVSNEHVVHLKLIQCYMPSIFQLKKQNKTLVRPAQRVRVKGIYLLLLLLGSGVGEAGVVEF